MDFLLHFLSWVDGGTGTGIAVAFFLLPALHLDLSARSMLADAEWPSGSATIVRRSYYAHLRLVTFDDRCVKHLLCTTGT